MVELIYRPEYASYDFGRDHPFSPIRLEMVLDLLHDLGVHVEPTACPKAEREDILSVHSPEYVACVEALGRGESVEDAERYGLGTPDNPIFPGMADAAAWLVGGTLGAARRAAEGEPRNVLHLGGGLHHAQWSNASGFCLFNDLAVAIRALTESGLYVSYLDIDVHHGDGVQALFYEDDHVQTISFHESGQYLFPGTGGIHELGQGMGRGLKINVPLEPFTEEESYLDAFDRVVPRALGHFKPGLLVVQAGADAHYEDPLADLMLTTRTYEALYRRIIKLAREHAGGRILWTLGGGYSLLASPRVWTLLVLTLMEQPLPESLPAVWVERWSERLRKSLPGTLHDANPAFDPIPRREEISRRNKTVVRRLLDSLSRYWL
ncbi:MAG: acetoin utilization protein AcuC [Acidobacteriota bacterium]